MTILEKYNLNKYKIQNGDIILFRGSALISKGIEYFDHANHNPPEGFIYKRV